MRDVWVGGAIQDQTLDTREGFGDFEALSRTENHEGGGQGIGSGAVAGHY